uniref:Retrovirus-related Pol polyprotein from transposon 412 family n=1 Tax=Cajanus cajan TaxID=3821 RepID=A0A151SMX7_CAJCA|nr:Retrovirus-related Pol polyprotein from transposon 412 family [Cajanus cajan]
MVVKTTSTIDHATDLAEVFAQVRKHNMRLNPEKCVFGVQGGKFLGFMITSRGIEANPEKCKAIIQMQSPQTMKEVQRLAGRLVSLSRFIPKLAEKAGPIFTLLKKPKGFLWTDQCEEAFQNFKSFLTTPPILQRPDHNTNLLYLAVAENAISAVIVQDLNGMFLSINLKFDSSFSHFPKIGIWTITLYKTGFLTCLFSHFPKIGIWTITLYKNMDHNSLFSFNRNLDDMVYQKIL